MAGSSVLNDWNTNETLEAPRGSHMLTDAHIGPQRLPEAPRSSERRTEAH